MIDIMNKRYYFFALSIIVILAGFIGFLVNGLQLDIQFQGGTIVKVQMPDDSFDTALIENTVGNAINKKVTAQKLQTYSAKNEDGKIDLLELKVSSEDTLSDTELNKVFDVLSSDFNVAEDAEKDVQSVQPFIGREMMKNALLAALIAFVLIILYVWRRFSVISGLSAAIMAVVALIHDVAVMFSLYAIFKIPVNESFVAAVLTILGYSINDTIIIYDRIRENSRFTRKADVFELVNKSVNETLGRSINTLLSTLISVVVVYIFASANNIQSLKNFALPLMVGLISGGYSSIFIAGPLWAMWKNRQMVRKIPAKSAKNKTKAKVR